MIELSRDNTYGVRYANIMSILKTTEKFLEKSTENGKTNSVISDIRNQFKINDFLKNDEFQLITFSEYLIFLITISSRVNNYLDKLEFVDEKLINKFCSISDKYLIPKDNKDSKQDSLSIPEKEFLRRSSTNLMKQMHVQKEKLTKISDEFSLEKENLIKSLQDLEKENNKLKEKLNIVEKSSLEYEIKFKDCLREIEILKNTHNSNIIVQEALLLDSMKMTEYKNHIKLYEMELDELRKDNDIKIRSYEEKISSLNEKIDIYEDKISAVKYISNENEKLKLKLKDASLLKDKLASHDELLNNLETKSRMIDNMMKEKQIYILQIEKCNKDLITEKEKIRIIESQKKQIELELNDSRIEINKMEKLIKNKEIQFQNMINLTSTEMKNSYNSEAHGGNVLYELEGSSVIFEIDKTKDERIQLLEKEIEELKLDKNQNIKNYNLLQENIRKEIEVKQKFNTDYEEIKNEFKKIKNEKDKLILEKEKLLLKIQKIELDNQKLEISDKKNQSYEYDALNEKNKNLINEMELIKKDNLDMLNKEKELVGLIEQYKIEIQNLKLFHENERKFNLINIVFEIQLNIKSNSKTNSEEERLKVDNQKLIQILDKKEALIKCLEKDTINLNNTMHDSVQKFNEEIIKRSEDLKFYKKSYEEQQFRVNSEHELISSSLFELAQQFMSLKNELQKKVGSNSNKHWLDNERSKNFPLDNK